MPLRGAGPHPSLSATLLARWREIFEDSALGTLLRCVMHLMMRPRPRLQHALLTAHCLLLTVVPTPPSPRYSFITRPWLQRVLAPYLTAFEEADSLVAIHVRSGWVDTPVGRDLVVGAPLAASCLGPHSRLTRARAALRTPEARLGHPDLSGNLWCCLNSPLTTHHTPRTTHVGRRPALGAD